jgi:hypothetical protein
VRGAYAKELKKAPEKLEKPEIRREKMQNPVADEESHQ